MVEKAYLILFLISNLIEYFVMIAFYPSANHATFLMWLLIVEFSYIFAYFLYKKTRVITKTSRFILEIDERKLDIFVFILALLTLLYTINTGYSVAYHSGRVVGQTFFSIFGIRSIFYVYYVVGRRRKSKLYWCTIILYLAYRIVTSYVGDVFTVFIFELYYRYKDRVWYDKKLSIKNIFMISIVVIFIILGGGIAYSFLQPLKVFIRGMSNTGGYQKLSIAMGIQKLIQRFTIYPSVARASLVLDRIANFYRAQGPLAEIRAFFRPLLPGGLMPNKEFYNMGGCLAAVPSGIYDISTSDNAGIIMYGTLLFKGGLADFLIWVFLTIFAIFFIRKVIQLLQVEVGEFNIFYFMILMEFATGGNLEPQFSQTYIKLLFFFPIMWLLGIFKVYYVCNSPSIN